MKRITITHATGLHARPAGQIAKAAQGFLSEVELIKGDRSYNGKSIMAVLSMGAVSGDVIEIRCTGTDAEAAEATLESLLAEINAG